MEIYLMISPVEKRSSDVEKNKCKNKKIDQTLMASSEGRCMRN